MTSLVSGQLGVSSAGNNTAVTVALPGTSSATNGLLLHCHSLGGSSADPTPGTPSGWTLVSSALSTASGNGVMESLWARMGDGTTASVTFAARTNVSRTATVLEVTGDIYGGVWWGTPVTSTGASPTTSKSVTTVAASTTALVVCAVGVSATAFGGSGATWTGGTAVMSTTGTSARSIATAAGSESGNTLACSWTNSARTAGLSVAIGGMASYPAAVTASAVGGASADASARAAVSVQVTAASGEGVTAGARRAVRVISAASSAVSAVPHVGRGTSFVTGMTSGTACAVRRRLRVSCTAAATSTTSFTPGTNRPWNVVPGVFTLVLSAPVRTLRFEAAVRTLYLEVT